MSSFIQDPVVLITGCSSGIGLALAKEYRKHTPHVVATARREESIKELEAEGFATTSLDVGDEESVKQAVAWTLDRFGRVDVLVNNAGFGLIGPVAEVSLDDLRRQLEINVVGALACMQAVFGPMADQKRGRIVNIGSVTGIFVSPFAGSYAASKAALHSISEAMRLESAPFGIDVMTVQPGGIKSNFGSTSAGSVDRFRREGSRFAPIADFIEKRAKMSQENNPMSAEDFSRKVVKASLSNHPPAVMRVAREAHMLPLLKSTVPRPFLDRILRKTFGLNRFQG